MYCKSWAFELCDIADEFATVVSSCQPGSLSTPSKLCIPDGHCVAMLAMPFTLQSLAFAHLLGGRFAAAKDAVGKRWC
jgi:hypothetical protein